MVLYKDKEGNWVLSKKVFLNEIQKRQGLILFISGPYISTKPKTEVLMDERVIRINEKAGSHAYWIIMSFIVFLWIADIYLNLNMKLSDGIIPIALIGVYSFFILRYHFGKKGVAE